MIEYVPKYRDERDEAEAVADMKEHWHAKCSDGGSDATLRYAHHYDTSTAKAGRQYSTCY